MLKNYDEFYKGNSESQIRGKIKLRYGDSMSALDELPKLMWDSAEMNTSIIVLGDRELSKLDRKLRLQVSQERESMHNFINRALAEEEGKDEVLEDDIKKRLEEVSDFSVQAHFLIADMKLRLDKLAQKT